MITMKLNLRQSSSGALSADFVDGLDSVNQNNSGNNVIQVNPIGFALAEGEMMRIAFSDSENDETAINTIGYEAMTEATEDNFWYRSLPVDVLMRKGDWYLCIQIVSDYIDNKGYYAKRRATGYIKFTVNASFVGQNGEALTESDFYALWGRMEKSVKDTETKSVWAFPNTLMCRDENGRAQVAGEPLEEHNDYDIVNFKSLNAVRDSITLGMYNTNSENILRFSQNEEKILANEENISQNVEKISVNARNIQSLMAMQKKTVMEQTLTDSYTARVTANGEADIVDGALTTPTKISGKTVKTINLFNPNRTVVDFGASSNTTVRNFTPNSIIVGLNYDNYYYSPNIASCTFENGKLSFSRSTATYGIGFNFDCNSGEEYRFSWVENKAYSEIYAMFYKDGVFMNRAYIQNDAITIPDGCNQMVILICLSVANEIVEFTNLQLEAGETATKYTPYFTGLKHAYFKGVRSIGRNLFNPKSIMVGKNYAGGDFPPRSTSETIKIENQQYYTIKIKKFPKNCDRYEVNFYEADKKTSAGSTGWQYTTDAYSFKAYYVNSRAVYASITFASLNDVAFQESDFSDIEVYWVKGDTIEKEEPYTEDTLFAYTEAQQLKEWDYLLPQDGKKITQTDVIIFDGTEDWEEAPNEEKGYVRFYLQIAGLKPTANANTDNLVCDFYPTVSLIDAYHNGANGIHSDEIYSTAYFIDGKYSTLADWKAHLSALASAENPLTVAYKTVTATKTDLKPEKASYFANEKGQEIVDEGETKNSEFGAKVTIEQDYAVWIGGDE